MTRFSNEFLVGLLTLVVAALVAWGVVRTDDTPDGAATQGYKLHMYVPSAEGIFRTTPVRLAGVPVGSVAAVSLEGGVARVELGMLGTVALPVDSMAEVKGEGLLGDKFIRVVPGRSDRLLKDGDLLPTAPAGPDLDAMLAQASAIGTDVKAITESLREVTADAESREQIRATIANVEALSAELRLIAGENRADLAVIADNLRQVSESLKTVVGSTGAGVDAELVALRTATERLDRAMVNVESITGKLDRGEGTVGQLLNDRTTIDSVNDTLGQVNALVGDVSRLQTEVYYRGDYYLGTDPAGAANPVAGSARNLVGLRIRPREDYWYLFEFVSHPQGSISYEDHFLPELGTAWREYVLRPDYRFSFQFAKRLHDAVLRFGVKESSGGFGADWMLFRDRAVLSADVYDFTYGSWPFMDGTPNLQITARALPWRHVYLEVGMDNVLLGARHGYVTGFAGGGFTFDDQDLKFVLAALPLPP